MIIQKKSKFYEQIKLFFEVEPNPIIDMYFAMIII